MMARLELLIVSSSANQGSNPRSLGYAAQETIATEEVRQASLTVRGGQAVETVKVTVQATMALVVVIIYFYTIFSMRIHWYVM